MGNDAQPGAASGTRGRLRNWVLGAAGVVLVLTACAAIPGYRAPLPEIVPPPASSFAKDAVLRGANLAAIGDCAVCHTAEGGAAYAGGRDVPTPFGIITATNITPDPATGIGAWSLPAFRRALREGIARDGRHLYPVLPYPHFTHATDEDIADVYAFLMTRAPVPAPAPPNRLPFPLDQRAILAGWNMLFLNPGPWKPDPARDADWNRGAYLVEALGHCGACHTPHGALGDEADGALRGGEAEGWTAPSLVDMPVATWTVDDIAIYLRTGLSSGHGAAAGPMQPVAQGLARVPPQDVHAMAVYLASLRPAQTAPAAAPAPIGANALFDGACAGCHAADAPMMRAGAPSLAASAAVNAPGPANAVQVILHGLPAQPGAAAPFMPPFDGVLTNDQVAELTRYLRARFSTRAAWTGIPDAVQHARSQGS